MSATPACTDDIGSSVEDYEGRRTRRIIRWIRFLLVRNRSDKRVRLRNSSSKFTKETDLHL